MIDVLEKIASVLSDRTAFNRVLAQYQKGMVTGDRVIYYEGERGDKFLDASLEVLRHYRGQVDYFDLLQNQHLLAPLLEIMEQHLEEGTRLDFFFGVTKVHILCYEHMLRESEMDRKDIFDFAFNYRKIFDAFELIAMKACQIRTTERYNETLSQLNEQVEFLQIQFKALVETFQYPVVIVDLDGKIQILNHEAYKYFALLGKLDMQLCSLLDYHFESFDDFINSYGRDSDKYVNFMNGEQFLTRLVKLSPTAYLFSMIPVSGQEMVKALNEKLTKLTSTETVVCSYIIRGHSTREISEELFISIDTVNTHRKNIRRKLGLVGRNETIGDWLNKTVMPE